MWTMLHNESIQVADRKVLHPHHMAVGGLEKRWTNAGFDEGPSGHCKYCTCC